MSRQNGLFQPVYLDWLQELGPSHSKALKQASAESLDVAQAFLRTDLI